ncbi:MAG: isoprenyl transferase [Bacteroidetes bacterium HGW-Bacteroidetes-16]|jgi:undecaprenyl diphosphate synthase|nr:MAG: isoprenyl transferase [Bacteroidetes bacterium HGW-Bacteroidetes-16]
MNDRMVSAKDKICLQKLPQHVAIIMDGNGRWALKQGKERVLGHHEGVESVREITEAAVELGIKYLTLYTFSTENWNRPKDEVDALMNLFVETIVNELDTLNKNDVSLNAIGDLKSLPPENYQRLMETIEKTSANSRMVLTLAMSYSARWEIVEAARKIAVMVSQNQLSPAEIDEHLFAGCLTTAGIPDPELVIRTSGELRVSNYLLWQVAYAEFYFTPTLWPEFKKEDFYEAIVEYQIRERRFGMTSDQLKAK